MLKRNVSDFLRHKRFQLKLVKILGLTDFYHKINLKHHV